jgi:dienelactone hydrolase
LDSLGNTWAYLLYLPFQYDAQPTRRWPILIHLPGLGSVSDNGPFANMYDDKSPYVITNGGVANYLRTPDKAHFVSDSFIVVVPWMSYGQINACGTNAATTAAAYEAYFTPLLNHIFGKYRADQKRMHGEGYCFGGTVLYKYATLHPTYFASLFFWGTGNAQHDFACADLGKACTIKNVAVQTIYGADDNFIGISTLKAFSDAIIACGTNNVTASVIPNVGHECWWYFADTAHAIYSYRLSKTATGAGGYPWPIGTSAARPIQHAAASSALAASSNSFVEVIGLNGQIVSRCKAIDVRNMKKGGVRLIRTLGVSKQITKVYLQDASR